MIVTEARILEVMDRLKKAWDHRLAPTLAQDARECLAYLHGLSSRHGPGFLVEDEEAPVHEEAAPQDVLDAMPEDRLRSLLREIVGDVRAGINMESSEDSGDMVIETLRKAGIITMAPVEEDEN